MFKDKIEKLKQKINEYIANGGDIYNTKRSLPYYEYMYTLKRRMEEYYNSKFTMEYIYSLCGIRFDREYNDYKLICNRLKAYADENGCVDSVRSAINKKKDTLYTELKNIANKYNVSMIDFLLFMTPYHFSSGRIEGDSIAKLKADLLKAYPNRDLSNIRRNNSNLYERMRNIRLMFPEPITMQELVQYLGFTNDRFKDEKIDILTLEKNVLKELTILFPENDVSGITNIAPTLYHQMMRVCFAHNQTSTQWLNDNGFTYKTSNAGTRLSATLVDINERKEKLLPLKEKYEKKLIKSNMNEIDIFYSKLEVMKKSLAESENINEDSI